MKKTKLTAYKISVKCIYFAQFSKIQKSRFRRNPKTQNADGKNDDDDDNDDDADDDDDDDDIR